MRINKRIFQYIEQELYDYEDTKKELEQCREEIIYGEHRPEVSVQSGLGDVTQSKAVKLASSTYILQAERTTKAIEKGLAELGQQHKDLYRLKYRDCLPWQEVMLELGISDRTYFRWRRELVTIVGRNMGVIGEYY
jgi:RinA family phage transcriptional activator